jgi:hypothetical protein
MISEPRFWRSAGCVGPDHEPGSFPDVREGDEVVYQALRIAGTGPIVGVRYGIEGIPSEKAWIPILGHTRAPLSRTAQRPANLLRAHCSPAARC